MKKSIFAVATLLISTQANAGEFFYEYSGNANVFYGYSDYSDKYRSNYKHSHTPTSAEIYTNAGYAFSNGTTIKINVDGAISDGREVEDYNHGEWGENVYGSISGTYGEISFGQIYNAAYQMAVGAPSVGAFRVNNSPIVDFIANPNWQKHGKVTAYRTVNSTYLNTDADAAKLSYITPEYKGLKLAVSYTPDSYSEAGLINKYSKYDNRSSYALGLYHYADIDFAEVESSLGYAYNHKNNQEISAGISLYRKGWTLGGSYRKTFTTSNDYNINIRTNSRQPFAFDTYRQSQAFNVGLSYEIGPFTTGVSYFYAQADKADNKDKILSWANRYELNKNFALYLATAYAEYKGNDTYTENNRGYAFISGLELNF